MRNLIYIPQPDASRCCGQAVVAMVARISLAESCKAFSEVLGVPGSSGYQHATGAAYLAKVLRRYGVACSSRLAPARGTLPARCIVRLTAWRPSGWGHWTLWWDGKWYDPAYGTATDLGYGSLGIKPASYLSLEIP